MGWERTRRKPGFLAAISLMPLAAGCAIATDPAVTSASAVRSEVASVELLQESDETGLRSEFAAQLKTAFANQGVRVEGGSPHVGDFSVSVRDSELATASSDAGAFSEKAQIKSKWYHKCQANRVSATLVIYARVTGDLVGRSEGEYFACEGDTSRLGELAKLLASETLRP